MAPETNCGAVFHTASHIPIAQLTPLLATPASRSIKAVVTLTWPYSSATGSVAFLLSEPDFRLRRSRGQVRVQFSGSSAKAVAKSGIASGDQVTLSLDGVEWVHDEAAKAPGRGVEFELKFTGRLALQFQPEDSQDTRTIDIDHPEPEPEPVREAPPRIPTPDLAISPSVASTHVSPAPPETTTKVGVMWSSPAFIKRARTSYGCLYESDYDPFAEDDGTVPGKGRKRTRMSSTWRYTSRSPTPEVEEEAEPVLPESVAKATPAMTDEACQTVGLEDGSAAEALADFARQSMNVGRDSYPVFNGMVMENMTSPSQAVHANSSSHLEPFGFPPGSGALTTEIDGLQDLDPIQNTPQSPYLQPVPSELLPQISPLVSSRSITFSEANELTEAMTNGQSLHESVQAASSQPTTALDERDDLYGASPARRRDQDQFSAPDLGNISGPISGMETSTYGTRFSSEDQYGQWQTSTAQRSHNASPYRTTDAEPEIVQPDHYFAGGQEQYVNDGFPIPQSGLHSHQYPDIDDALEAQQPPGWGLGLTSVPYPDLPDHGDELETVPIVPRMLPNSAAMSRSHSAQSPVVDLTESSDEDEQEGVVEGSLGEDLGEEEELEGSFDEDEEGSLDDEDGFAGFAEDSEDIRNRNLVPGDNLRAGDYHEDEEGDLVDYSDEEEDDLYAGDERVNLGAGQDGEEFFDEEEEGSYDEEEEDEDMEPPAQRAPVVIDLLSSDDEDDAPPPRQSPTDASPPQHPHATAQPEYDSEGSGEDSGSEDSGSEDSGSEEVEEAEDEMVPYAERAELKTAVAPRTGPHTTASDPFIGQDDEVRIDDESDAAYEEESALSSNPAVEELAQSVVEGAKDLGLMRDANANGEKAELEGANKEGQELETPSRSVSKEIGTSITTAIPGQFGRPKASPFGASLYSRMFNLDGANDEPEPEMQVSYPTLPKVDPSPPLSNHQAISQQFEAHHQEATNTQVTTPDATQMTGQAISTTTSFTSVFGSQPTSAVLQHESGDEADKMEIEQAEATLDASEYIQVDDVTQQTQAMVMTTETKITVSDEDVGMDQESGALEIIVESVAPQIESLDEQIVELEPKPEFLEVGVVESSLPGEVVVEAKPSVEPELSVIEEPIQDIPQVEVAEAEHVEEETYLQPESIDVDAIQEQLAKEEPVQEQAAEQALASTAGDIEPIEFDPIQEQLAREESILDEEIASTAISSSLDDGELIPVAEKPQSVFEAPRRSQRNAKPTVVATKAKEPDRPVTPKKAAVATSSKENQRPVTPETEPGHDLLGASRERPSPRMVLDTRAPVKGHDASIELSMADLASPPKHQQQQRHDLRKLPVADLKLRLSRALRTELGEFTALKVLRYHLNQKLDVLAVATTTPAEPQRAKNGPRHYQITFNVTDPSVAPSGVTEVQIFRPYKDALPTIQAGDGILLRNFQVMSVKNRGFGLRSVQEEGSSWAVFKDEGEPEVRGPPVEFGDGEKNHVMQMRTWWGSLDAPAKAKIARANGDKAGTAVGKSMAKAS